MDENYLEGIAELIPEGELLPKSLHDYFYLSTPTHEVEEPLIVEEDQGQGGG